MAELSRASPQSSSTSASPSHDDNGTNSNNTNGGGHWSPPQAGTLAATYPVNTLMEIKVAPAGNIIRGVIYCTDEFSNSIVIKRALVHTTTSSEITIVNADSVMEHKAIDITSEEAKELVGGVTGIDELKLPLPNVSKKALEEREKRAIRLAEESFGHINQKASPEGQKIFDKLLKACNEVVWKGESIIVLKEIRVDPPYAADNCSLIVNGSKSGLEGNSLERVRKIVSATTANLL